MRKKFQEQDEKAKKISQINDAKNEEQVKGLKDIITKNIDVINTNLIN